MTIECSRGKCLADSRGGSYHTQIYLDFLGQLESLEIAKSKENGGNEIGDAKGDDSACLQRVIGLMEMRFLALWGQHSRGRSQIHNLIVDLIRSISIWVFCLYIV